MKKAKSILQKWEYAEFTRTASDEGLKGWNEKMEKMGEEGWEAYSMVFMPANGGGGGVGKWTAFFKRPKQ